MPNPFETRAPRAGDIPALAAIAEETLFPGEMIEPMITPALEGGSPDIWRVVCREDVPIGFAFAQPEAMTDATWNLRAIAVSPQAQGGAGTALLRAVEAALHAARMIIIDTTQLPDQERARHFYVARGYTHVATIPAFFGAGEDKVTFLKSLR